MSDLHSISITAIAGRYLTCHLKCVHPDVVPPQGESFAFDLVYEPLEYADARATPELLAKLDAAKEEPYKVVLAVRFLSYASDEAIYRIEVRHERHLSHLRVGMTWRTAACTKHRESNEASLLGFEGVEEELKELFGAHPVPQLLVDSLRARAAGGDAPLRDGHCVDNEICVHLNCDVGMDRNERPIAEAVGALFEISFFGDLDGRPPWFFGFWHVPECPAERVGSSNHQFATAGNDQAPSQSAFSTTADGLPQKITQLCSRDFLSYLLLRAGRLLLQRSGIPTARVVGKIARRSGHRERMLGEPRANSVDPPGSRCTMQSRPVIAIVGCGICCLPPIASCATASRFLAPAWACFGREARASQVRWKLFRAFELRHHREAQRR